MDGPQLKALDFLRQAHEARSINELETMFAEAIAGFGYITFGCVHYATPGMPILPRPLFGRDPVGWAARYVSEGFAPLDPTLSLVFSNGSPFTWSEATSMRLQPAQTRVFEEAARSGLTAGFVVPVAGCLGEVSAVLLAGDRDPDLDPRERATLSALATVLATYGRPFVELADDKPSGTPLTSRETECLTWVAQGKTDWEIGTIVGIAPRTVGVHIEHARAKLEASTRTQAVFEAWRRGWLVSPAPPGSYANSRIH